MSEDVAPTRREVERRWRALIAGEASRDETHQWARPWVEERCAELEPMTEGALQSLHGFDLTCDPKNRNLVRHGGHAEGRPYYHPDRHIEVELDRWLQILDEFDRDPEAFRERTRARTKRFLQEEAEAKARAADAPQLRYLPESVRASALGLASGEIMWPRGAAYSAVQAVAASGSPILGLDLRSDGPGRDPDPEIPTEIPWTVCRSGSPGAALAEAIAGLDAAWSEYPDYHWVLITWKAPEDPCVAVREEAELLTDLLTNFAEQDNMR